MRELLVYILCSIIPTRHEIKKSVYLFLMVIFGAVLLMPVVARLPILGWDWYFFFTAHNPDYNLYSARSAYPPFARYAIESLTWIDNWRTSLHLLTSISLVTIGICTWRAGGRAISVFLSIFSGAVLLRLWAGHPDCLALMGFLTGFVPLALIKPQVIGWALLSSRKLFSWTAIFLLLSVFLWPMWPLALANATFHHEAAVGWQVTGWQTPIVGVLLLAGAGRNPWRLMAAGALIAPYLTPSQLAVLAPSIGAARGWKKVLIWTGGWMLPLGVGLGGTYKYLYFLFPLAIYLSLTSPKVYADNVYNLVSFASDIVRFAHRLISGFVPRGLQGRVRTEQNRI